MMIKTVTLEQMLEARESRVARQQELLKKHKLPLVSFTMNIAGPIKHTQEIEHAFLWGHLQLCKLLPENAVKEEHTLVESTGCEALYAVAIDPQELKRICVKVEEETPLGRLFDMDVIDVDGSKLERATERRCLICGKPGRSCAASRAHSVEELQAETNRLITEFFANESGTLISDLAVSSLINEVNTTPKPGLVDQNNNGSHRDMTMDTFVKSARALRPYFEQCFHIGRNTADTPVEETFNQLRSAGQSAELAMYTATNGINTHKGAIYSFGILCGALGRIYPFSKSQPTLETITDLCAALGRCALADFNEDASTAGMQYYHSHGISGVRGEAASGFRSVIQYALPAFDEARSLGHSSEIAGRTALIHLIANVKDTALYHRGGEFGAAYAATYARSLLTSSPIPTEEQLKAMDTDFTLRNLSPGGCADLLAVTYFLDDIRKIFLPL